MVDLEIIREKRFEKVIKKIKDKETREHIKKIIKKIIDNPDIGEHLRYSDRQERKVYIGSYRLIYSFDQRNKVLYLIDLDKRDIIYEKRKKI